MEVKKSHFILYVADQARSAAFYENVLQRQPTLDVPGMTEFRLGENCVLGLMPNTGIERLLNGKVSPSKAKDASKAELYLVVDSPEEFHARALEFGATELSKFEKRNWGDCAAYSLDLDGHVLAFASREVP